MGDVDPDISIVAPEGLSHHYKNLIAGSGAGSIARFVGQPLDVLKIRFQLQQQNRHGKSQPGEQVVYRSIPHAFKTIYAEEGIKGFWRAHAFLQVQGILQGAAQFWIFRQIRPALSESPVSELPRFCNFASGFLTGNVVALMFTPMDALATSLMQRSQGPRRESLKNTMRHIHEAGGILTFYQGGYTAILHAGSVMGLKFMFYNLYCELGMNLSGTKIRQELPAPILLAAGAATGSTSQLLVYPMDLVKRRLQTAGWKQGSPKGVCKRIIQCVRLVIKQEGIKSLYKGLVPCVLKSAVSTGVTFSSFDKLRKFLDDVY